MIHHHRFIEKHLNQAFIFLWDGVIEEAEKIEHTLSKYLEEHIDELLSHPTIDPHDSPIPSQDGIIHGSDLEE